MALNPLPPRVPLVDGNGMLTREGFRFLMVGVFDRIGGKDGLGSNDLAVLAGLDGASEVACLRAEVDALRAEIASLRDGTSLAADAKDCAHQVRAAYALESYQVNWSSPGAIGFYTPNIGRFTTIRADLSVSGSPSVYFGTDGTSGWYSTSAGNIGISISGNPAMIWGAGGTITSKQITSTVGTGAPPFVISSTTKVINLYAEKADSANYATNAGSASTAGFANTAGSLAAPSSYPADASDLPTCIALANALKNAAIAKGL